MNKDLFEIKESQRYQYYNHGFNALGPVLYWMNRDQRVEDNWALIEALERAKKINQPVIVVFSLLPSYGAATNTHFNHMKRGLKRVQEKLISLGIGFIMREGDPLAVIPQLVHEFKASLLVTDFNPLRKPLQWRKKIAESIACDMIEVDAHNIVPCFVASKNQEYGAYTLRPKIHRLLSTYLKEFPIFPGAIPLSKEITEIITRYDTSGEVLKGFSRLEDPKIDLDDFIHQRLARYDLRSDPSEEVTSRLSALLHFGQISAQRIALEVKKSSIPSDDFLEELIVRRELADNFCYYNSDYDSFSGFPKWAQNSLNSHRKDPRPYTYTLDQLERAVTHDRAWNAAQMEMVKTGYMHGYMRMYWAKKILEWTKSPEEALEYAIYLNDHYEMDGRDPNGYTGIAWALGGVHDRPWQERPIFGMIRYMNEAGLKRKFDIERYIERISKLK